MEKQGEEASEEIRGREKEMMKHGRITLKTYKSETEKERGRVGFWIKELRNWSNEQSLENKVILQQRNAPFLFC